MAARLSRRTIARHVADRLMAGDTEVLKQVAAHLLDARRTREVDLLVRDIEFALQQRGVVVADVTTTQAITTELKRQITKLISTTTGAAQVQVRPHTDDALIGGVRVQVPGAEYDASVRRQITKLQAMKV